MHPIQYERHREQISILELYYFPHILRSGLVSVDLCQQAERINDDSHPYPTTRSHYIAHTCDSFVVKLCFNVESHKCQENVTSVMYNENHGPCYYLVTEGRKQYKRNCHRVMQGVFVELPFSFSLEDNHLKEGERVDSKLYHKESFKFISRIQWPVRILFVDLRTRTTSSHHAREPILVTEKFIGENSDKGVENAIERQLQGGPCFVYSFLSFIFRGDDRFNPVSAKVEPRIFNDLHKTRSTKMPIKPTRVHTIECMLMTQQPFC